MNYSRLLHHSMIPRFSSSIQVSLPRLPRSLSSPLVCSLLTSSSSFLRFSPLTAPVKFFSSSNTKIQSKSQIVTPSSSSNSPKSSSLDSSTDLKSENSSFSSSSSSRSLLALVVHYTTRGISIFLLFYIFIGSAYLIELSACSGPSMLPTIPSTGCFVLINRWEMEGKPKIKQLLAKWNRFLSTLSIEGAYWNGMERDERGNLLSYWGIKRGEIVTAISKNDPNQRICKRVIGLPGDKIRVAKRLSPLLMSSSTLPEFVYEIVPMGHVWLQGDNLPHSFDSRHYGPVPVPLIHGKVIYRLFPADLRGSLNSTLRYSDQHPLFPLPEADEILVDYASYTMNNQPPKPFVDSSSSLSETRVQALAQIEQRINRSLERQISQK